VKCGGNRKRGRLALSRETTNSKHTNDASKRFSGCFIGTLGSGQQSVPRPRLRKLEEKPDAILDCHGGKGPAARVTHSTMDRQDLRLLAAPLAASPDTSIYVELRT